MWRNGTKPGDKMKTRGHSKTRYIFGPGPSRRLGRSLGVDLAPHKTCTLDCVYCECGKTTRLTLDQGRYTPALLLKAELDECLSRGPELDYITFSGAGEPTLNEELEAIIRFIKTAHPGRRIAVLTNGTLLHRPGVRSQLRDADLVIASLDAASEKAFQRINRPHPDLNLTEIIEGIAAFGRRFAGKLWVEIFIVPGINDTETELKKIKDAVADVAPDKVQLNTLDRPGTESWVKPAAEAELVQIAEYLDGAEIVKHTGSPRIAQGPGVDIRDSLLATISRRPCTAEDIAQVLGLPVAEADSHIRTLVEKGEVGEKVMPRGVFYFARP